MSMYLIPMQEAYTHHFNVVLVIVDPFIVFTTKLIHIDIKVLHQWIVFLLNPALGRNQVSAWSIYIQNFSAEYVKYDIMAAILNVVSFQF